MSDLNKKYTLSVTTQGPLYPPAEVMDVNGNFVVVGMIPDENGVKWTGAIVAPDTELPEFGSTSKYKVIQYLDKLSETELKDIVLYTLPLPIPLNNYQMLFAPEQRPNANNIKRESIALHIGHIDDYRECDGKRLIDPITLHDWMLATGELELTISSDKKYANFDFDFKNLVPNSLYTVMSLREKDLQKSNPTRPGPLGIPNVFITDHLGNAKFWAKIPNAFPAQGEDSNRIINVVVLYMSSRQSYGGAIGLYGLGGDIHAHLKLQTRSFDQFCTIE
ncbi:MAG: hypothetical protein O2793_10660 [Proteobacteria bacterium]|nr:hypothetical protein [Pseudomonadota bacterium]MDA1256089.1 hypothetical protein [Pseudomonadota bacterium]